MSVFVGSLCAAALVASGAVMTTHPGYGLLLMCLATIGLGMVYSVVENTTNIDSTYHAGDTDGGLTLRQLIRDITHSQESWSPREFDAVMQMPVYTDIPYVQATGWFKANIGGRPVLIIERGHND